MQPDVVTMWAAPLHATFLPSLLLVRPNMRRQTRAFPTTTAYMMPWQVSRTLAAPRQPTASQPRRSAGKACNKRHTLPNNLYSVQVVP
jgi:hypothetical protein